MNTNEDSKVVQRDQRQDQRAGRDGVGWKVVAKLLGELRGERAPLSRLLCSWERSQLA